MPRHFGFETAETAGGFEVDRARRTIFGLAVPFGPVAKKNGRRFRFGRDSLVIGEPLSRTKLLIQHDRSQAVGKAIEATIAPEGLWVKFSIARGPEGDKALSMAEDGVWDGLSVGLGTDGRYDERDGVLHPVGVSLAEISLTPSPAFDDARVSAVAATSDPEGNTAMPPTEVEAPAETVEIPAPAFDATGITEAIAAGFAALGTPAGGREVVPAGRPAASVAEPLPYRFDGSSEGQCFSRDVISALSRNDGEAAQRVEEFLGEVFNVTVANAATLNPNINRPDLYVDQREFEYPIFSAINKGTLTENTPFVLPKFGTSSGLVADHVEATEPASGALTTTAQTITPSPLSGKAVVNREVWDQGGNPQLDTILWRQIVRAWYEGLESFVVAQLEANAASITDILVTTAAADAALEASLTSQLATLQYVRGGNRFRDFFVQVDLFKALVAAKDTNGRKLFPYLAPQNATGTMAAFFAAVDVGGLAARPAWALAASGSVTANSWLFDRGDISAFASAPRKLTMDNIKVATVEVGVWGYKAFAITDFTGIRQITYDPI
jgi:HK97 family phage prohead protease